MSRQDVANLAFKITGLYCLIKAIPHLGYLLDIQVRYFQGQMSTTAWPHGPWLLTLVMLTSPGLLVALGVLLITQSQRLAQRVFKTADSPSSSARILAAHALVFSAVGLYIVVDGFPDAVAGVIGIAVSWKQLLAPAGSWINQPNIWESLGRQLLAPILKLILGVGLFLGSHGLVRIWSRLRSAGIRDKLGVCLHCGYDLTGNTSGTCPECGNPGQALPFDRT